MWRNKQQQEERIQEMLKRGYDAFIIPQEWIDEKKRELARLPKFCRVEVTTLPEFEFGPREVIIAGVHIKNQPRRHNEHIQPKVIRHNGFTYIFLWLTPEEIDELGHRGVPVVELL